MSTPARRIADLEALVIRTREPDGPPTWTFFAQDRHMAAAGYGGQSPAAVLEDIEAVERVIRAYDEYRREQHLDVIDLAVLISSQAFPDHAQDASGVAGMVVEAFWHHDRERFGEPHAWRHQRNRADFESLIASRLAVV